MKMDEAPVTDQQAIADVLAGDVNAFRAIVERFQSPLFAFARSIIGDAEDAEDVTQDVFLTAFSKLQQFDPEIGKLSTWLFRIAHNKALNFVKRRRPLTGTDFEPKTDQATPAVKASQHEQWQRLQQAIEQLPLDQRTAFVLFDLQGCSYDEVSRIEQVPLGTVKSRIARARSRLRQTLGHLLEHE